MKPSKSLLLSLEGPWGFPLDPPALSPQRQVASPQARAAADRLFTSCSAQQCPNGQRITGLMIDQESTPQR